MNNIYWAVLIILLVVVLRLPNKASSYKGKPTKKKLKRDIRRINRAFERKGLNDTKEFEVKLSGVDTKSLKISDEQKINDVRNRINMVVGELSTQPIDSKNTPSGMSI